MAKDTFQEIPEGDIPCLLEDLEKDLPVSVHALSFLKVIQQWKAVDCGLEASIRALNGDFRSRMILFYTLTTDKRQFRGTIHKWTHRTDDVEKMTEALKRTKDILPWFAKYVFLSDLTPETVTAAKPALAVIWETKQWKFCSEEHLYWLPKEEVAKWEIDIPHGTYISFLNETHLKDILEHWRYSNFDGAEELVSAVLQHNFGLGLFDSASGELMAWAAQMYYGGLGLLQTKEHLKKKGYGRIVLRATAKEVAIRNFDVHLVVLDTNIPSKSLTEKCNFRLVDNATWIDKVDDYILT